MSRQIRERRRGTRGESPCRLIGSFPCCRRPYGGSKCLFIRELSRSQRVPLGGRLSNPQRLRCATDPFGPGRNPASLAKHEFPAQKLWKLTPHGMTPALNNHMSFVIIIGLVTAASVFMIGRELIAAPEGYEDEYGFHVVSKAPVASVPDRSGSLVTAPGAA